MFHYISCCFRWRMNVFIVKHISTPCVSLCMARYSSAASRIIKELCNVFLVLFFWNEMCCKSNNFRLKLNTVTLNSTQLNPIHTIDSQYSRKYRIKVVSCWYEMVWESNGEWMDEWMDTSREICFSSNFSINHEMNGKTKNFHILIRYENKYKKINRIHATCVKNTWFWIFDNIFESRSILFWSSEIYTIHSNTYDFLCLYESKSVSNSRIGICKVNKFD